MWAAKSVAVLASMPWLRNPRSKFLSWAPTALLPTQKCRAMNKGAPHSSATMTDLRRLVDSKQRSAKRMSNIDENKPKARSSQRKAKAKQPGPKVDQRSQKPDRRQDDSDDLDLAGALDEALPVESMEPVEALASPDPAETRPAITPSEPRGDGALVPVGPAPIAMIGPVENVWIGFQTIAHAHRAYAWRSIEETMGLVENLALARSLDRTLDIQKDFTRKAYDGYLEDSQKIWRLYSDVTRQIFRSFEHLGVWRTRTAR